MTTVQPGPSGQAGVTTAPGPARAGPGSDAGPVPRQRLAWLP
ncbi:MAG TPA: hypothetical protein VFJ07_01155 [Streptosporangiaceae bacterium]|nr:hypothetical protein [Streptosporangiaceae bacterium]